MKGYIVYPTYDIVQDKTIVQLFGRLENGESFVTTTIFSPYFYIKHSNLEKVKKLLEKFSLEETDMKNFKGEKLVKISGSSHIELNKLSHAIHKKEIETYESDLKPHFRFLIDHNIFGTIDIEGNYENSEKVDRVYANPDIKPVDFKPKLKVVSIDTESTVAGDLICIGLYSENYKKNFMVTSKELKNAVSCKTEEECLQKFKEEFIKLDPDIITGWNITDYDMGYLQGLFRKYKIQFDIGRNNDNPRIRVESNFFKSSTADITGRQVLDGLNLIKDPFIQEAPSIRNAEFDTYTLEDVSQAILNEGKLIKGKNRHVEIEKQYKSDPQKIVDYNLQDCKLAYDILEKTDVLNLSIERCLLTGLPLDRLTSSIIAFDSLYIREAKKKKIASPATLYGEKEERIKGGYVKEALPGIYHNALVLDFKSLYPSIIRTFNIDPASMLDKKEKNTIETPNGAIFKNGEGVLPIIIERLHQAREKAKKEKRELASYAIKIIMNSFFGVLANPNCRYFNLDLANAITHFGQMIIKLTAEKIEQKGHKVIYSDTDSIFIDTKLSGEKAQALGKELQDYINDFYQKFIKEKYNRQSVLEIQFSKHYIALMLPKLRGTDKGAKKRYAGLLEKNGKEVLETVGIEAQRGDWTEAAQQFQRELLMKVFHRQEITQFIKDYIKKLKAGKLDDKLIYRKSIRKELSEYTKTTPPHVKAARQLDHLTSNVIEYYITVEGPEPIQKLKHSLDYEHYIEKQIKPLAEQVLTLFGKTFEDIFQNSKQAKLF